jgi:hypothetical protein
LILPILPENSHAHSRICNKIIRTGTPRRAGLPTQIARSTHHPAEPKLSEPEYTYS